MSMGCSMKSGAFLSESGFSPSFTPIQSPSSQFLSQTLVAPNQKGTCSLRLWSSKSADKFCANAQASYCVSRAMRWWDKTLKPNMIEIQSAQELVDTLKDAGDRLVVIDFYSPACGGCRALHPKICQLAESYPDAIILKVNHEELNEMCHALHIHVLPFFRFYKGSQGRLCSFSCTVSTIRKLKDALAKHSTELQPSLVVPAKGLDESELLRLASVGEISMIPETPLPSIMVKEVEIESLFKKTQNPTLLSISEEPLEAKEDNSVLVA